MQYWTACVSANILLDLQLLDIVVEYASPSCINFNKY